MEITEVRVALCNEERLKAFVNVTFDGAFVVRGLKVIDGPKGYFVSMPSRKRDDATHQDICHPVTSGMRERLEETIMAAYHNALRTTVAA